jgi:DNA-binding FadR family transcriptional regulator
MLAAMLREQILDGSFADGAMLPAERELVEQTGLSRGSVREGLRILEAEGLIKTRSGRYGGSCVTRPSGELVSDQINRYARVSGISLESIVQARVALEPALARMAALNRTEDDIRRLAEISRRVVAANKDDVSAYLDENVNWHCALAQASHNTLLHTFTISIAKLIRDATGLQNMAPPNVRLTVIKAHEKIEEAIIAGDADLAERRMHKHVTAYAEHARTLMARTQKDQAGMAKHS